MQGPSERAYPHLLSAVSQTDKAERQKRYESAVDAYQKAIQLKQDAVQNGKEKDTAKANQQLAGFYINMADAYSRTSNGNRIGIAMVQHGPGAEHAFGGIAQAYADSVPLLLLPNGNTRAELGLRTTFDAVDAYRKVLAIGGSGVVSVIANIVPRLSTWTRTPISNMSAAGAMAISACSACASIRRGRGSTST